MAPVTVRLWNGDAFGSRGTAANAGDGTDINCVSDDGGTRVVCYAVDHDGNSVKCASSDWRLVGQADAATPDANIWFQWDASFGCTSIIISKASYWDVPGGFPTQLNEELGMDVNDSIAKGIFDEIRASAYTGQMMHCVVHGALFEASPIVYCIGGVPNGGMAQITSSDPGHVKMIRALTSSDTLVFGTVSGVPYLEVSGN